MVVFSVHSGPMQILRTENRVGLVAVLWVFGLIPCAAHAWSIDASRLFLAPPPVSGSFEEQEDFRVLHRYQVTRSVDDCRAADAESAPLPNTLFGPQFQILSSSEFRRVLWFSGKVLTQVASAVEPFKKQYLRQRPFIKDPTILPCIKKPDGNKSYPSGHATIGRVMAQVLSDIFPTKRAALLQRGERIAENRVIGGVHHPSDIRAAEILTQQIVEQLRSQPDYWDEVRALSR